MARKKGKKSKKGPAEGASAAAPAAAESGMMAHITSMAQSLWGPAEDESAAPAARVLDELPEAWIAAGAERRLSARLAPAARSLERALASDRLSAKLEARPDHGEVTRLGVHRHAREECRAFYRRKSDLERQLVSARLSATLDKRPSPRQARERSLCNVAAHGNVAPRLHGVSRRLSRQLAADKINAALGDSAVHPSSQHPAPRRRRSATLEPAARALEHRFRARSVGAKLFDRPAPGDLAHVLHPADDRLATAQRAPHPARESRGVAGGLHAARHSLQREMTRDQLSYLISARPDPERLAEKNAACATFHGGQVSRAIQTTRKSLDFKLRRSSLHAKLEAPRSRPPPPPPAKDASPGPRDAAFKPPLTDRRRYRLALEATYKLYASGEQAFDRAARAKLKERILEEDPRVAVAVETFWIDSDADALLDTLFVLATFEARQDRR